MQKMFGGDWGRQCVQVFQEGIPVSYSYRSSKVSEASLADGWWGTLVTLSYLTLARSA